jgi:hypothetical protein
MNWLNIETTTLDSEAFVGSDPTARATWLCLLRFCAGQENGGKITACKSWPDRKWQQLARVTKAEVEAVSALWSWDGEDLTVWSYPTDKQHEVQHRRERARTNGTRGGRPSTNQPPEQKKPTSETNDKPTLVSFAKAEGEGEGEGEEKEKEKRNRRRRRAADAAPRARNPVMDALATVGGGKPEEVTQWGPAVAARAEIVAVTPDVTPDEIRRRAANYRTHFDGAALTPTALAKHWAVCASPKPSKQLHSDKIAKERAAEGGAFSWEKEGGF